MKTRQKTSLSILSLIVLALSLPPTGYGEDHQTEAEKLLETLFAPINFNQEDRWRNEGHNLAINFAEFLILFTSGLFVIDKNLLQVVTHSQQLLSYPVATPLNEREVNRMLENLAQEGVGKNERIYMVALSQERLRHTYTKRGVLIPPVFMPIETTHTDIDPMPFG